MPKPKILVADDDQVWAKTLSTHLKAEGFNVILAYDALQTLMFAMREAPQVIILDIKMPGGTGIEALKKLKASSKTGLVPVIAISASVERGLGDKVKALGAEQFLPKPLDLAQLSQLLRQLIGEPPRDTGR